MEQYKLDLEKYATIARQVAAESCVLLKNDKKARPLRQGDKVAVFGRCAFNYYKSGVGSGGLVNTRYVVSILDALRKNKDISLDENLLKVYKEWLKIHLMKARGGGTTLVPKGNEARRFSSKDCIRTIALVIIGVLRRRSRQ